MNMNIFNALLVKTYSEIDSLKDLAIFQIMGDQNPAMKFFAAKTVADTVMKLEKDLKAEKAINAEKPTQCLITMSEKTISKFSEMEMEQIGGQIGIEIDTSLPKEQNIKILANALKP